jgi:hypothetical protein
LIIPPISWAGAGKARQVESIRPEVRTMAIWRCMTYSSIMQFPCISDIFDYLPNSSVDPAAAMATPLMRRTPNRRPEFDRMTFI